MPGATFEITIAEPPETMPMNATMMPHTVPKRPSDGATEVNVASSDMFDSSARSSCESEPSAAARTDAMSDSGSAGPVRPFCHDESSWSCTPAACRKPSSSLIAAA